jgi:Peptidase family M28
MNSVSHSDIKSILIVMDQSFGSINLTEDDNNNSNAILSSLDINPYTENALSEFAEAGLRIILIAPESLLPSNLIESAKQFVPTNCKVITYNENLDQFFSTLKSSGEIADRNAIFVAADRVLRKHAIANGYLALPHLSIAALALKEKTLFFVRVRGEAKRFSSLGKVVPYFVERYEHNQMMLLGVMSQTSISQAISHRLQIELLPLNFMEEDAMLVYLDRIDSKTPEKLRDQKVLFSDGQNMLVALGPDLANDAVPFHDKHGHFFFLYPDPSLLKTTPPPVSNLMRSAETTFSRWPLNKTKITPINGDMTLSEFIPEKDPVDPITFQKDIDRYGGNSNLDGSGPLKSRHCEHTDNKRAVKALLKDLRLMGYYPFTHSFTYQAKILRNVIADLPGHGYFKAEPDLAEQVRQVFAKYPNVIPSEPWISEVLNIVGRDWFVQQNLESLSPLLIRKQLEDIFLKGSPWWLKQSNLSGLGAQMIVVCCHMDSTANNESIYNKSVDPAPGIDDNCSGVAATLAIARYLEQYRRRLTHTVRFCFFNAEEMGLFGSQAYATYLKNRNAALKAVINLDMMGYNKDQERIFEVHAGYPDPAVRDLCLPIADVLKQWAANLGKLGEAQIYRGTKQGGPEDYDRDIFDGAIRRSDHYSFQHHGYPACHISEDFFANLPTEPGRDPNPNYHTFKDKVIDKDYCIDIASAAAFAIKELASKG